MPVNPDRAPTVEKTNCSADRIAGGWRYPLGMRQKLTDSRRSQALAELSGWTLVPGRDAIAKHYQFADFSAAWGFMCRVALAAEKQDHYPEWSNVWNRVDVVLSTHDAGGLTENDVTLAKKMDEIAGA